MGVAGPKKTELAVDERPLSVKNLEMAALKAMVDTIDEAYDGRRQEHLVELKEAHKQTGAKSFDIELDDAKVGTVSMSVTKGKATITDEVALLEWAKEHAPQMVHEVVIPPQPEQRFTELHAASKAALLKRVTLDAEGQVVDGDVVIPGVKITKDSAPNNFSIRVTDREALIAAFQSGRIQLEQGVVPAPPAIEREKAPWES